MKNKATFIVTRGLPGSGKSTYVNNILSKDFIVVCPDELRLKYNGLEEKADGTKTISQKNPHIIWGKALSAIKKALKENKNVVLDATSCKPSDLKKYKKLAEQYDVNFDIADFSKTPIEVCKERNKTRMPEYKRVDDSIIDKMAKDLALPLDEELTKCMYTVYSIDKKDIL